MKQKCLSAVYIHPSIITRPTLTLRIVIESFASLRRVRFRYPPSSPCWSNAGLEPKFYQIIYQSSFDSRHLNLWSALRRSIFFPSSCAVLRSFDLSPDASTAANKNTYRLRMFPVDCPASGKEVVSGERSLMNRLLAKPGVPVESFQCREVCITTS